MASHDQLIVANIKIEADVAEVKTGTDVAEVKTETDVPNVKTEMDVANVKMEIDVAEEDWRIFNQYSGQGGQESEQAVTVTAVKSTADEGTCISGDMDGQQTQPQAMKAAASPCSRNWQEDATPSRTDVQATASRPSVLSRLKIVKSRKRQRDGSLLRQNITQLDGYLKLVAIETESMKFDKELAQLKMTKLQLEKEKLQLEIKKLQLEKEKRQL